jgi:hypothetical protein
VLVARAGGAGTARANAASIDFVPDLLMVMMERSAKCLFVRTPQRGATPPVAQDYFAIGKIPEKLPSRYIVTRYIWEPWLDCIFRSLHPYFLETGSHERRLRVFWAWVGSYTTTDQTPGPDDGRLTPIRADLLPGKQAKSQQEHRS